MAKTSLRKEIMLSKEEVQLLRFAMKCTGLDMTTTMRLMMRRGIIDEIIRYRDTGVPQISEELVQFLSKDFGVTLY